MNPSPVPPRAPRYRRPYPVVTTLAVSILLATLFTCITPAGLLSPGFSQPFSVLLTPQPGLATNAPPAMRIGIVAGHAGNDSGAVCRDAGGTVTLTEADVNQKIATLVEKLLVEKGFQVDVLNEFDTRLNGYRAVALVSIHNDSCDYIDDQATGFKVAAAMTTRDTNRASRLTECLRDRYSRDTGLRFHAGSITNDMREYHAFSEVAPETVAAIIETGFLNLDQQVLTQKTDVVARGIVDGIMCFIYNENIEPTAQP
jgi:N-acetylmuramoyl-L-alanine amidase